MSVESTQPNPNDAILQYEVTVDEYLAWVATLDNLQPELQYIVISKSGARIVEGGSKQLQNAHDLVLSSIKNKCEPEDLKYQIWNAHLMTYSRYKKLYVFAAVVFLISACVGTYKLSKVISSYV